MKTIESIYKSRKKIAADNFIGGLFWALGATIGVGIIFALVSFILKNVNLVPYIGEFVSDVLNEVLQKNPQLLK